jgi:hypothetical protein
MEPLYSYGLLALELAPSQQIRQSTLTVSEASALGALVAEDLQQWLPSHDGIDIVIAGASFDPVEILRPQWPIHQTLAQLLQSAPNSSQARLLCLGAHAERMPDGLQPNRDFQDGPLRLIPFVLSSTADAIITVQHTLEAELLERGMAGAKTALLAQTLFSVTIEHARYMTHHDLVALMSMQYQHNGLELIWPIIETALFAPQQSVWLDVTNEPLIFFKNNTAHIAMLDNHQWALMQTDIQDNRCEQLENRFQMFQMRQRQIAALLTAHNIEVHFDFCADATTARSVLRS